MKDWESAMDAKAREAAMNKIGQEFPIGSVVGPEVASGGGRVMAPASANDSQGHATASGGVLATGG